MSIGLHVKCRLFWSDFNVTPIFPTDRPQIMKHQTLLNPSSWSIRTDGQTWRSNFAKAPTNGRIVYLQPSWIGSLQNTLRLILRCAIWGVPPKVCHLRCAIPVVCSNYMVRWIQSKNTTIKYGEMMVFISKEKLHVSAYSGHFQCSDNFLLKEMSD